MTNITLPSHRRDELPKRLESNWHDAIKLEWLTVAYLVSAIIFLYLTLGSSQAMKAAWLEDSLSLIPPIIFLISHLFKDRDPTKMFPYGFHRFSTIAFMISAVALLVMGLYLVIDSAMGLINREHPTIGTIVVLGQQVWLGWLMIPALLWSGIPAVILGRKKKKLAKDLHDKVLHTDGDMNAADWKTSAAAITGIIGIGFGLWWADSAAALFIGFDILRDGFTNSRDAFSDLLNSTPETVERSDVEPVMCDVKQVLQNNRYIDAVKIRFREEGHIFFGEGHIVLAEQPDDYVMFVEGLRRQIIDLDWRIYDFVIVAAQQLPDFPDVTEDKC